MTRRSPRAGGSGQEKPRLAGKEPGAYRATTMFVHAETRGKVMVAVHARVPMVTPEEQPAS